MKPIKVNVFIYFISLGNVDDFLNFIENDTDFHSGMKTILDAPTFGSKACSVAGHGVENPINPNITSCEFGLENNFQVTTLCLGI